MMRTNPCNKSLTDEMKENGYHFIPTMDEQIVFQSEKGGTACFGNSQDIREFLDTVYEIRSEIEDETIGARRRARCAPQIDFYSTNQDVPPVWAIEPEMIMNPHEEGYEKFAEECGKMRERMNQLAESGKLSKRYASVCGSEALLDFEDKLSISKIKQTVSFEKEHTAIKQRKLGLTR